MPTVSLVSKPSMSASCPPLQVRQQEVITAYFAKRITEEENGGIKVKFEETKNAKIGEEVYIVIETQNLQGEELVINILQGKENVLADMGEAITVQVTGTDTSEIKATVGYCGDNENITNETDFEDWAVAKVTLQPKEETKQEEWTECLNTATEKKAQLYLEVDASTNHSLPNFAPEYPLYQGCNAESNTSNLCNNFLYGDDAFFEVEEVSCYCGRDLTEEEVKLLITEIRKNSSYKGKSIYFYHKNKLFYNEKTLDKAHVNNYTLFAKELNKVFTNYDINTCLRKIHFLAQAYWETQYFTKTKEYGGNVYLKSKRYYPYYGRGFMQLTHLGKSISNLNTFEGYKGYAQYSGLDVINNPDLISDSLTISIDSGGWFWKYGKILQNGDILDLNTIADTDKISKMSYLVNGGLKGKQERIDAYTTLKKVMKYEKCVNNN